MGVLFLAFITSCPEIVTSLGSITVVYAPDLATGDLLGAVIINIFVIALLGILCRKGSILVEQSRVNIFAAALTILMLLVIIGFISLRHFSNLQLGILNVGFGSILLGLIYIIGIAIIYRQEIDTAKLNTKGNIAISLKIKFFIAAAIIIISGLWLANIGKKIADFYSWNEMYVGVLLIAFATTMPEFVVSLTALKRNSVYMAAGNLLGSNFFNLFIIAILDSVFRKGEFFSYISRLNVFPALLAMILTAIAMGAMLKKPAKGAILARFPWDSAIIIAVFLVGHYLIFNLVYTIKW